MNPTSPPLLNAQSESRAGLWLLLTAILSGIALTIPMLTAGPLDLDEYGTYWLSDDRSPLTLWERSLNYENIPPLSPWVHRLSLHCLGDSEWSFRLPSAIWYLLAVGTSYLLGREIRGPLNGGLCALIIAWHPTALGEILFARCYALSLFLSAVCFWMTLRWIRKPQSPVCPIIWTIAALALIWTHYLNAAVTGLTALTLLARFARRSVLATLTVIGACLLVAGGCVPLFPAYERMSEWGEYFGFQTSVPFLEAVPSLWWAGLPAGLLAARTLQFLDRTEGNPQHASFSRLSTVILLLWGLSPVCAALIIRDGDYASLANPRYRIGFDIAGGCLLALLITRRSGGRPLGTYTAAGAVIACLVVSWLASGLSPFEPKRLSSRQSAQWKQLAEYIQEHGTAGELVFVQSGLGEGFLIPAFYKDRVFMDYSACRLGRIYLKTEHPKYALPFRWDQNDTMRFWFVEVLKSNRNSPHPEIWVVSATDTDLNRISLKYFQEMAAVAEYRATDQIDLQDATLIRYEPEERSP